MRNFLDISDLGSKELRLIIDDASHCKIKRKGLNKSSPDQDIILEGKSMIMIFEKPSTRTRISFEIAIKQLGGSSIMLNPEASHYGKGDESIKDTAKVLTEYSDIVMLRTSSHKILTEFEKYLKIPIINGLSDKSHPCQIMADILTFEEFKGNISGKTISWIGDGNNNMSNSLIEAAGKFNFELRIGCPEKYKPNKQIMTWAKKNNVNLNIFKDPKEAVKNSDCVMTDKWVSMNDKVNKKSKKKSLKKYQVNNNLFKLAKSDAIFMHCLPVGRGEEVTDEIIDGKQSVVWKQALNRVHVQKSIIKWCLN
jgi:ornithine carbamoyltransferase